MDHYTEANIAAGLRALGATRFGTSNYGEIANCDARKAQELLALVPERQRRIDTKHVANIARARLAGTFVNTSDPIKFIVTRGPDGRLHIELCDGQHRIASILKAGMVVNVVIAIVPDEAFPLIDTTGKPRTLGQVAKIAMGRTPHATVIAALVNDEADFPQHGIPKPEKIELVKRHPFLEECMALHAQTWRRPTAGYLAGALRCLRCDRDSAMRFFSAAFANVHIVDGQRCSPAQLLASTIAKGSRHGRVPRSTRELTREEAARSINAFNAYARGDNDLQALRGTLGDTFPVPRSGMRRSSNGAGAALWE